MLAIVVIVVLVGGGLTAFLTLRGPAPTAAEQAADRLPPPDPIVWTACSDRTLVSLRARCGALMVPLDWSKPSGRTIRLAVSRIAHTASTSQGVVIFNPGGPGVSGLATNADETKLPARVRAEYDWIGFDPRGVGSSQPALSCDPHYSDGPRPAYGPTGVAAWTAKAKGYAEACEQNGAILGHMSTTDSAKDLDRLRAALGQQRITFYGFSFGTYLGQVYATLFPDRLRRMVLDSTDDPREVLLPDGFDSLPATDRVMRQYFAWVATWNGSYGLGTTAVAVEQRFARVEARLAAHPVGGIGASEWLDTFLAAGYDEYYWPYLTDSFQEEVRMPKSAAADLEQAYRSFGAVSDNELAVLLAVHCTTGHLDPSVDALVAAATVSARTAPYATWSSAMFGLPCHFWPVPSQPDPRIDGRRAASVLMIDQTDEGVTPYSGSLFVRGLFPNARLLAEPGGYSHATSLFDANACVIARVADYLDTGALPPRAPGTRADETCAPTPPPLSQDDQ